jgi:Rho guanine nucleotide exchange factor 12
MVFCYSSEVLRQNSLAFFIRFDSIAFGESQSEDEQFENDLETDPPNWQQLVSREVLLGLKPCEIKRQEVINGEYNQFVVVAHMH